MKFTIDPLSIKVFQRALTFGHLKARVYITIGPITLTKYMIFQSGNCVLSKVTHRDGNKLGTRKRTIYNTGAINE